MLGNPNGASVGQLMGKEVAGVYKPRVFINIEEVENGFGLSCGGKTWVATDDSQVLSIVNSLLRGAVPGSAVGE